ncbi:MAG TPA: hypothetical protein VMV49_17710 [Candidatus Deferrimicrobium sp.]|nr:hypothetical protein [Candidatus Deferrimicrobium sp.]
MEENSDERISQEPRHKNKKMSIFMLMPFNGEFPSYNDLVREKLYNIIYAISLHGGHYTVAQELGFKPHRKPDGYWTKERIDLELDNFIEELGGKFPTVKDWERYEKKDLYCAIYTHQGGMNAMRIARGFDLDKWSEKASYYRKRGFNTEQLIVDTLKEYADMCDFTYSYGQQIKVGPAHQIELVCGKNRKIGFDVTRSDTKEAVEHHWKKKEYYNYLDTYIVIVVSKNFTEKLFKDWNENSPENVIIVDYRKFETFLNRLINADTQFELPFKKRLRLDAIAECTYENKEESKRKFRQKKGQTSIKAYI